MAATGQLADGNLAVTLESLAQRCGWSALRAYLVGTAEYTYADVFRGMRETAALLAANGIGPGDQVAVALSDRIEFVWTYLAVHWLGGTAVLLNPRLPARELAALLGRCTPSLIICDEALEHQFPDVSVVTDTRLARNPDVGAAPPPCTGAMAPGYAQFTSGTTGNPGLCFHRHSDPLVHQQAFGAPVLGLQPGDVTLSISKTYFAYGLGNSVLYPLLSGATAVLIPETPTPELVLELIKSHGVRVLYGVPGFYARLLRAHDAELLRTVELAVCAGETLPAVVEADVAALDGPILLNGIGTTEVGQTFASNTPAARRPGTVGRALPPYEVGVVDEAGNDAEEGRLIVRGATVAPPQRRLEESSAASDRSWYATGDLAQRDEDGYITVLGRYDDVEIVGGVNIHPTEVEDRLMASPEITEAAVCSVTDLAGVSRLIAYVVPRDLRADPVQLAADLLAGLRGELAPYKVPKRMFAVERLPRTYTGKLRRRTLRELAAQHSRTGQWSDDTDVG